ncbi:MAG TPA: hypothetical protein DDX70_11935 [Bacteroides sp.]|nr:hypothetical protein [Bacteroides sp.]
MKYISKLAYSLLASCGINIRSQTLRTEAFYSTSYLYCFLHIILFTGCRVGGVTIESVIKYMLPYFAIIFVALLLVTYIPAISMFLPGILGLV